jgi:hypothetical protein
MPSLAAPQAKHKPAFGMQLGLFFRAPLTQPALWRLIPATFIMLLAQAAYGFRIPVFSVLMWWVALLAQFVVLWYGFELLARFAAGVFDADALWPDAGIDTDVMLRAAGVWVVLHLVALTAFNGSHKLGLLIEALLAFAKPAIVMLIVQRRPMMDALNPNSWWEIIDTLGSRYFMLFVMLWTLFALRSWAYTLEPRWLIAAAFADFFSLYALLVSCCMMGYCCYEKAFELNLTTEEDWQQQFAHQRAVLPSGKSVDEWMNEGKHEEAVAQAYELARTHLQDIDHQLRYYNLLKKLQRKPELIERQTERLMVAYAHHNQVKDAVDLLNKAQGERLNVLHDAPADLYALARKLYEHQEPYAVQAALSLVASYTDVSVGEMQLPKFLLLQAKCHHALKEKAEAKALLERIATRYPPEMAEVKQAKAALGLSE